jgi:hypothetical protein
MKRYVLAGVLMALLFPTVVFAGKGEQPKRRPGKKASQRTQKVDQRMRLRGQQLGLEQRQAEVEFDRQMKELELQERRLELERKERSQQRPGKHFRHCRPHRGKAAPAILIVCLVVHILLAVWVYQDIRRRQCGSGIWIVIVLLAGLLGVLPYTIVRLGDTDRAKV